MTKLLLYGTLLQCLCFSLIFADAGKAQSISEIQLRLKLKDVTVEEALSSIEKKTDFRFLYSPNSLKNGTKLTFPSEVHTLKDVLTFIAVASNLKFKRINNTIVVDENKAHDPYPQNVLEGMGELIVKGKVIASEDKQPLPGVNIMIKGTTRGATTDINGEFSILVDEQAILLFSIVGYQSKSVEVGNRTQLEVVLEEDISELEEIVVVGFGTQKKKSVVGALQSVTPSELKIPSSNLTTALSGRVAGLISYQRSGEPGSDNAQFFVRGVTTFGLKKSPLILIDGVELSADDLARLQPDDIESFSILKDATTTAIYGARGANGIILVTTKEGVEGRARVSARLENSFSSSLRDVELADPVTYMRLHNEAVRTRDPIESLPYSERKIANTLNGENPVIYPATDWQSELFKDWTTTQRANVNVNGGGKVVRYYLATSFSQDNGILKIDKRNDFNSNIDLKRISVRSNVNIDLTRSTELVIRFNGTYDDYRGPIDGASDLYKKVVRTNPVLYPKYYEPDASTQFKKHILFGNYGGGSGSSLSLNPYADLLKGYRDYSRTLLLSQLELKQDLRGILKGLSAHLMINTNRNSFFDIRRLYEPFYYTAIYNREKDTYKLEALNEEAGRENLDYSEGPTQVKTSFYLQGSLNYKQTFSKKHEVSALLVLIQSSSLSNNAGSLQKSLPYRNMGLSGRLTYGFNSRYFAEFNFGYNGSEKFAKNNRFGFFPSAGVGWTVSEEPFFSSLKPLISHLKLRASYGLVGNDAIGSADDRFFYLSQVDLSNEERGSTFGTLLNYYRSGVSIDRYENDRISWETATKFNLGFELNLFDDKIVILADAFQEQRNHILMNRSYIPPSMGLEAAVRANVGKAESHGFDFSIDYNESFSNSFWLTGRVNFTYAVGKFKFYEEPDYSKTTPWRSHHGQAINQQWGYIAERLFVDEAEVLNSPTQFGEYGAGDIKYKDLNNDGIVDFRDEVPIGHPTTPEIVYGFGFSAGYKNFDFSAFFQGSARVSFWIDPWATAPFINTNTQGKSGNNALLKVYADNHWSEENQDVFALWPRLSPRSVENNNKQSTWFMRDGSFLRLKQLEVGYSFPGILTGKLKIQKLRAYLSGTNLLTLSKFKLWDPEMAGNGLAYPIQRVINIGLQVSF
ncbi:SusC/RagA family TonB-linked outer membrane protein [Rapidithrix thailandica]